MAAIETGRGAARTNQREFAAQTVGVEGLTQQARPLDDPVAYCNLGKARTRVREPTHQRLFFVGESGHERLRVAIELQATLDDLDPGRGVRWGAHLKRKAKAVEQLWAKLALLRVAAADEYEAGGVTHTHALALDHVLARGSNVEQQVDQVILATD